MLRKRACVLLGASPTADLTVPSLQPHLASVKGGDLLPYSVSVGVPNTSSSLGAASVQSMLGHRGQQVRVL